MVNFFNLIKQIKKKALQNKNNKSGFNNKNPLSEETFNSITNCSTDGSHLVHEIQWYVYLLKSLGVYVKKISSNFSTRKNANAVVSYINNAIFEGYKEEFIPYKDLYKYIGSLLWIVKHATNHQVDVELTLFSDLEKKISLSDVYLNMDPECFTFGILLNLIFPSIVPYLIKENSYDKLATSSNKHLINVWLVPLDIDRKLYAAIRVNDTTREYTPALIQYVDYIRDNQIEYDFILRHEFPKSDEAKLGQFGLAEATTWTILAKGTISVYNHFYKGIPVGVAEVILPLLKLEQT
ncbi:MAG: hypothetical protein QXF76_03070 [Candidatus Anstonellales archaeon]